MDLVTPSIGLIIWQSIIFILLVIILGKFAWRPILKIISNREESIALSLKSAQEANAQLQKMELQRKEMLKEISFQRDQMIEETKKLKQELELKAKKEASFQAEFILKRAKEEIENQKFLALNELKTKMADFSIKISEKLLKKELEEEKNQKQLLERWLKEF
jgi:F-type H+-transporting ATPase subunit b